MPGSSAKTAEVKLRVPIELASAIETYAQAHTHGNKTRAYLHFLQAGLTAQSDQAPVTKADLLAVAAATQASVQRALAAQKMPALPSPEDFAQDIEESVSRSVAKHMAKTSETMVEQIAEKLPTVSAPETNSESLSAQEFQRGFVAGKEAEDRRAIAVALGMNTIMRTMCGAPFIRAFLPDGQAELLAADLPEAETTSVSAPAEKQEKKDEEPKEPEYTPKHVSSGEEKGKDKEEAAPLFAEPAGSPDSEITGVLPPVK